MKVDTEESATAQMLKNKLRRSSGPVLLGASAALVCLMSLSSCEEKRPELSHEEKMDNLEAEIQAEIAESEAEKAGDSDSEDSE